MPAAIKRKRRRADPVGSMGLAAKDQDIALGIPEPGGCSLPIVAIGLYQCLSLGCDKGSILVRFFAATWVFWTLLDAPAAAQMIDASRICDLARNLALHLNTADPSTVVPNEFERVRALANCERKTYRRTYFASQGSVLSEWDWGTFVDELAIEHCDAPLEIALATNGWSSTIELAFRDGSRNGPSELCRRQ